MKFKESVITDEPVKGLSTFTIPTKVKDVVTISGSMLGGILFSGNENNKISSLTSSMLDKGTQNKSKHQISDELESMGAEISFISSNRHINFTAHCLKSDLGLVVELVAEQLKHPVFPEEELALLKKRMIGNLEISKDDTKKQALISFLQELYPEKHHNYRNSIEESIKRIETITSRDLVKFHKKVFGLGSLNIAAAGDISNKDLIAHIRKNFDGWGAQTIDKLEESVSANKRTRSSLNKNIKDKTSSDINIGQSVDINDDNEDYMSLMMGVYILGGNFSARLMQTVRDEQGLTYGIGSTVASCAYGTSGHWYTWGTFAPKLVEKGIKSTLEQINEWYTNGITEQELKSKKTTLNGSFQVSLDTTGGLIDKILTNAEKGRDISYLDSYTDKINKLNQKQINSTIQEYIDPTIFVTSVAGSRS